MTRTVTRRLVVLVLVGAVVIGARLVWRGAMAPVGGGMSAPSGSDDGASGADDTGRVGWRLEVPGSVGALAGDDELTVTISANSVVTALDPGSGSPLWAHELGDLGTDRPALSGDRLALRGRERAIVLDSADGSLLWEAPIAGPGPVAWSGASVDGSAPGAVLAGSWDGTLAAFEPDEGSRRWSVQRPGAVRSVPVGIPPAMAGGEHLVVVVSHGERSATIAALRVTDGEVVWERELGAASSAPAAASVDSSAGVVVGDGRGGILALDPGHGRPLWTATVGAGFTPDVAPVVDDEQVIVADRLGVVHALAASDGERLWSRDLGVPVLRGSPTVTRNQVVVTTTDGRAVALDRTDGGLVDVSDADAFVVATAYGREHLVTGLRLSGPGMVEGVAIP